MFVRNLTFKSTNLGDNVSLMLCFTPPVQTLYKDQFPVAWKVTTLAARGRSVMNATYVSQLGFSASQVGEGSLVTAGNYTPIDVGESTTLQLDNTANPPVYHWTDPEPRKGLTSVQAVNGTGQYSGIGLGFITDLDGPNEDFNSAIMYPQVGAGLAVTAEFTPVLSAYVALDYQETQMIRADIQSVAPIWTKNLLSLGASTTIVITKNAMGGYEAQQIGANVGEVDDGVDGTEIPKSIDWFDGQTRVYCATLSFPSSYSVQSSLKTLSEHLLKKGYGVRLVFKGKTTEARIHLVLPMNTSCNQAEKEVLGFIEGHEYHTRGAIVARDGEVMAWTIGRLSLWASISPATPDWYASQKAIPDFAEVLGKEYAGALEGAQGNTNGDVNEKTANGTANGYLAPDAAPQVPAPVSYGKTRTPARKASAMNLSAA
ncbi:hypothetical protein C8Q80DRAFT_951291 [Daedaleopsis nitida]|nr:hypothetical protein C8Q80DRAFT_951291 [Daedaleopsis nitida]